MDQIGLGHNNISGPFDIFEFDSKNEFKILAKFDPDEKAKT